MKKEKRAAELALQIRRTCSSKWGKKKRAAELSLANKELSNQAEELQPAGRT
jgi:hypothetical protein